MARFESILTTINDSSDRSGLPIEAGGPDNIVRQALSLIAASLFWLPGQGQRDSRTAKSIAVPLRHVEPNASPGLKAASGRVSATVSHECRVKYLA
jgi:hypothetical protein